MRKPYKTYKELKQKQKARIANFMYRETLRFYLEHSRMPDSDEAQLLCSKIYNKVLGSGYRVPLDDIQPLYFKRLEKYEDRIQRDIASGVTLESLQKKPMLNFCRPNCPSPFTASRAVRTLSAAYEPMSATGTSRTTSPLS